MRGLRTEGPGASRVKTETCPSQRGTRGPGAPGAARVPGGGGTAGARAEACKPTSRRNGGSRRDPDWEGRCGHPTSLWRAGPLSGPPRGTEFRPWDSWKNRYLGAASGGGDSLCS